MDYLTYSRRLTYILELIRKGQLSSPHDLAGRFGCTERTVRNMISDLKKQGYHIKYSRQSSKYCMIQDE